MNKKQIIYRLRVRIVSCTLILLVLFLLIGMRLYWVQVVDSEIYTETVKHQAVRYIITPPVRGQIFASDGQILAGNIDRYDLTMHPSLMRHPRGRLMTSSYMLNVATYLQEKVMFRTYELENITKLRRDMTRNMSQPFILFQNLTPEEMARCEELIPQIPGIAITPRIEREHPLPGIASHILGFTALQQRANTFKLAKNKNAVYTTKELVGREGIEKKYNQILTGTPGLKTVIIDTNGFIREEMPGTTDAIDGSDIWLTLDTKAQCAAEDALKGFKGALVAVDIHTGAVLAMASSPTFDITKLTGEVYQNLVKDKDNSPLLNRAVNGVYMPGSIVKPLVALAALENGAFTKETTYDCTGAYHIGNTRIRCAHTYGHGPLDMKSAIAFSCNPYFIHAGITIGIDALSPIYRAAGFGEYTGIDITEIQKGISPERSIAPKLWGEKWLPINTAYSSIGQGAIEVTPLQAALYTAAIANGGKLMKPYVIDHICDKKGNTVSQTQPVLRRTLPVSKENLAFIQDAMIEAIKLPGASAAELKNTGMELAAKTGTAEVGPKNNRTKNTWIVCYGPMPEPAFAVACVIENGVSGGRTTAPVVKRFLQKWLNEN